MSRLSEVREQVLAALSKRAGDQHRLWLCYDTISNAPLGTDFGPRQQHMLRLPDHLHVAADIRPRFVDLGADLDDRLFEASITHVVEETATPQRCLGPRSICAWAWASPAAVAAFVRRCTIEQPAQGWRWARWHDPRVMHQFWPTLDADGRNDFLAGFTGWVFADLCGHVRTLEPGPPRPEPQHQGLLLAAEPWSALLNSSAVVAALGNVVDAGRPLDARLVEQVQSLVADAARAGLASADDIQAYAALGLSMPWLMPTAALGEALAAARRDPGCLEFKIAALRAAGVQAAKSQDTQDPSIQTRPP